MAIFYNFRLNILPKRVLIERPCQDIMPRTLTRQTKTDDVKLKHMTPLIGLALRYFARDDKLTAAAKSFLKSPILFYSFIKMRF